MYCRRVIEEHQDHQCHLEQWLIIAQNFYLKIIQTFHVVIKYLKLLPGRQVCIMLFSTQIFKETEISSQINRCLPVSYIRCYQANLLRT